MASENTGGKIPCVEQPELRAFDRDGDGVLSLQDLRVSLGDNERVQQVVDALEANGVAGIRYTGCGDVANTGADVGTNGESASGEDIATLIARAAVAQLYQKGQG